jgi:hypothetical protein
MISDSAHDNHSPDHSPTTTTYATMTAATWLQRRPQLTIAPVNTATTAVPTTAAIVTSRDDGEYNMIAVGHGSNDGNRGHGGTEPRVANAVSSCVSEGRNGCRVSTVRIAQHIGTYTPATPLTGAFSCRSTLICLRVFSLQCAISSRIDPVSE